MIQADNPLKPPKTIKCAVLWKGGLKDETSMSRTRVRGCRLQGLCWQVVVLWALISVSSMVSISAAPSSSVPLIGAISFKGNQVTRNRVLRQQLLIKVGQPLVPAAVEASRQAIMNLGLFVRVQDHIEPMSDHRVMVVFTVKEKTYTWALPRLGRTPDGDISYGGQIEFDNLYGLNQRLKLVVEQKQIAGGGVSDQQSIEYSTPRFPGTALGFSTKISHSAQRELLYAPDGTAGEYRNDALNLNAAITQWLNQEGPNSGWSGTVGMGASLDDYQYLSGAPGLASSGRTVGVNSGIDYTNVALGEYGYRRGVAYGLGVGLAGRFLGGDYNQIGVSGYYRGYRHLGGKFANLNYRLQFGYSSRSTLSGAAYTLGGADSLRGYVRNSLEGNIFVLANIEYLHPVFGNPVLRGVLFTDVGNAWYRGNADPWQLEPSLGVGLRWHIDWLVNVNLRVDAAYALGQKRYQIYVGSRSMF